MATTSEVTTLNDEQLSRMRDTIGKLEELQCESGVVVLTADVAIDGDKTVRVHWNAKREEFLVDV